MILDLGLVAYGAAHRVQLDLVARRKRHEIDDTLVIVQHHPVFTIGRSVSVSHVLCERDYLTGRHIDVLNVDRGGDITYHGPGQIVIYPIIDLKERRRDLHAYMRLLESSAIAFLRSCGIEAWREEKRTGVWTHKGKIAFIGIAASNWVTYHGMSINVSTDLSYFRLIRPCGLTGIRVTSLSEMLDRQVTVQEITRSLISDMSAMLEIYHDDLMQTAGRALA